MSKIIVFDGPSACGKTTLINQVFLEMKKQGLKVEAMTERNTLRDLIDKLQIGNIIRSGLPPLTESLFWTMNQAYRVETELSQKQADIVLVDRYVYTPIVYQYIFLKAQGASLNSVSDYISKPFGIALPEPDLSLILMAPISILKERFKKREKREMSQAEISMTEEALEIYKKLAEKFKNYHLLDSNRTVEKIYKEAEHIIKYKGII